MGTGSGLITPVVKDVGSKGLTAISHVSGNHLILFALLGLIAADVIAYFNRA
jgi:hypothetical protein